MRLSAILVIAPQLALFVPACVDVPDDDPGGVEAAALSANDCPDVPAVLLPDADQRLDFELRGVGDQVYTCAAGAAGPAWTLLAPDADLLNANGVVVGAHYAGPTWEFADGSTVVGLRVAAVPSPEPGAIPWLKLTAKAHDGEGRMTRVTTIQRIATVGGVAPAAGCDADHLGAQVRVGYQAQYIFYRTVEGQSGNPQACGD